MTDRPTAMPETFPDPGDGRTRHYGEFYGLDGFGSPGDDRPVLVVLGNCQAEATRILLDGPVRGVRIPAVHEFEPRDVPFLRALLSRTDVLVTQPIVDGYRGLPVGTAQAAAMLPARARVVRIPVLRFAGLYPCQVTVRAAVGDPPGVPYHDLRTLLRAHDGRERTVPRDPDVLRAVAARSVAELRRRESAHGTVVVSDLLEAPRLEDFHTVNHPGNRVLTAQAERVRAALGIPEPVGDPGMVLLRSVFSPVERHVLAALGAPGEPRSAWVVEGEPVADERIVEEQLRWYAAHPEVVAAGLDRHADTIALLGLA